MAAMCYRQKLEVSVASLLTSAVIIYSSVCEMMYNIKSNTIPNIMDSANRSGNKQMCGWGFFISRISCTLCFV